MVASTKNKLYPDSSQILTIRLPYTMFIGAKSESCWKYSSEDSQIHFPPGSTFQLIVRLYPLAHHLSIRYVPDLRKISLS